MKSIRAAAKVLLPLPLVLLFAGTVSSATWSYDNNAPDGPTKWGNQNPTCNGKRQSPIDIQVSNAVPSELTEFVFSSGYYAIGEVNTIQNNGHTVQLDISAKDKFITGGSLISTYRLVQLHMHWGDKKEIGSEHLFDGKAFPLEIHFVHFDSKNFNNISEALSSPNGLAVLGIMAKIGSAENKAFQAIIDSLSAIKYANTNATFNQTFSLMELMPSNRDNYFRYEGSLTTPKCQESVIWTVFQKPISVTEAQLRQLRTVKHNEEGGHDAALVNNYRPVQKLNGRTVKRSFQTSSVVRPEAPAFLLVVMGAVARSFKFI